MPMHWASKMQTEIALSTTEAEYIALSQSMREILPIMWLLQEAHDHGIPVLTITHQRYIAKFLKTMQERWRSQKYQK